MAFISINVIYRPLLIESARQMIESVGGWSKPSLVDTRYRSGVRVMEIRLVEKRSVDKVVVVSWVVMIGKKGELEGGMR